MAIIEGLGSIAGNFAQGYRQAREQKNQESLQQTQLQYEHADRLFKMADMVQDPKMKDTLFSSATQILDSLESGGKQKSNPKGIGAIFGSMFGIGHQKPVQPAPVQGPPSPREPGTAPEPTSPGSQTFGSLGDMFGSALETKPAAAPASTGPVIPPVPQVDLSEVPSTREAAAAVAPFQPPSLMSPRGTPVSAPVAAPPQLPAAPAAAVARHPQSGQPLNIPAPIDIQQRAIKDTASPQYGFRDPYRQKIAEQQYASQIMDTLLKVTDQHLAQNPQIKTLAAADNDPDFGPEFRQVMDALGRYEAAGIIEKGTLENWQKQRFEDVRFGSEKYNPTAAPATIEDAFGNRWRQGSDGKFNVPAAPTAEVKKAPAVTLKESADAAFVKNPAARTTADIDAISGYKESFKAEQASKGTPTDRLQTQWLDDPKNTDGKTTDQISKAFEDRFHAMAPETPVIVNARNPLTNRDEPMKYDRASDKLTPVGIVSGGAPFNAEKYKVKYEGPAVANAAGRMESPLPVYLFDPDQLIGSHRNGDPGVSLDQLMDLVKNPSQFVPGGAKKVEDYISSLNGPYPTPGTAPKPGKK